MKHRWNTHGLADFCQSGTAKDLCRLGREKSGLGTGNSIASGGKNNYVMLDQLFYNGDMPRIQRGPCVVSPNHAAYSSYAAIYDVVIECVI